MEAKLVVVHGAARPSEFRLKLPTIIGRSRNVDVPVGHPLVSRQHCELYEEGETLMIRDLGSLNGTFVGDERIAEETALKPGALFTVGPLTFKAVYGTMPAGDDDDDDIDTDMETAPQAGSHALGKTVDSSSAGSLDEDPDEPWTPGDDDAPHAHAAAHASDNSDSAYDWLSDAPPEVPVAAGSAPSSGQDSADKAAAHDSTVEMQFDPIDDDDEPAAKPAKGKAAPPTKGNTPPKPAAKGPVKPAAKPAVARPLAAKPAAKTPAKGAAARRPMRPSPRQNPLPRRWMKK